MSKITYNVCRNNLGEVSDTEYSSYKSAVAAALTAEYPDSQISIGDSGFANASEINVSGADVERDEIENIANRVFENQDWATA